MNHPKPSVAKATPASTPKNTGKKVGTPRAKTPAAKAVLPTKPTPSTKPKKSTATRQAVVSGVSHEQIATVAYRLSLQNQAASAEENWLQAEAKLLRK